MLNTNSPTIANIKMAGFHPFMIVARKFLYPDSMNGIAFCWNHCVPGNRKYWLTNPKNPKATIRFPCAN